MRAALIAVTLGVAALLNAGCEIEPPRPAGQGPGHRSQHLALRPEQELEIGEEAYHEVLQKSQGRILPADDPRVRQLRGYRFDWEANVIESRQINAFCLPGGKIIVFTGILPVAENDDQLATVLSHEIAHALAHHSNERIALKESGRVSVLTQKAFSRQQEAEADHIGVFLMTFAGYDPEEAIRFWVRMSQMNQGAQRIPEFLSDHPSDAERIDNMRGWVPMAVAGKRAFDEGRIAPSAR